MKVHAVVLATLLASWSSGCCDTFQDFRNYNSSASIVSNGERAMVAWSLQRRIGAYQDGNVEQTLHVATVEVDGSIGADVIVSPAVRTGFAVDPATAFGRGEAGTTTVLWGSSGRCSDAPGSPGGDGNGLLPFVGTLVAFDGDSPATQVEMSPSIAGARALAFDGSAYQAFWIEAGRQLRHRSVDQTGARGPIHELGQVPATTNPQVFIDDICLSAAGDGAGSTLITVSALSATYAFVIDTTGQTRHVWDASANPQRSNATFWFQGEWHVTGERQRVVDGQVSYLMTLTSIDPVTGTVRLRDFPPAVRYAGYVRASDSSIYVMSIDQPAALFELDPDLQIVTTTYPRGLRYLFVIGNPVVLEQHVLYLDVPIPKPGAPGRIQAVQLDDRGDEAWRVDIAVDSDPVSVESCDGHT